MDDETMTFEIEPPDPPSPSVNVPHSSVDIPYIIGVDPYHSVGEDLTTNLTTSEGEPTTIRYSDIASALPEMTVEQLVEIDQLSQPTYIPAMPIGEEAVESEPEPTPVAELVVEQDEVRGRFKDIEWFSQVQNTKVIIGGAGGIGSWLTLLLSRNGIFCTVFDHDTIEVHNLGGQLFKNNSIGTSKVQAVRQIVQEFTDKDIIALEEEVTAYTFTNKHVITAFDNLTARKYMYNRWKQGYTGNSSAIFIDANLSAEQFCVYCIRGNDYAAMARYEDEYINLNEADIPDAPCTAKQTTHIAVMLASYICSFFINHLSNISSGEDSREVPFKKEYFAPINYTEDTVIA